jgi:hypothetical protein
MVPINHPFTNHLLGIASKGKYLDYGLILNESNMGTFETIPFL